MNINVVLKDGRSFTFHEDAIVDDREAGWVALLTGKVSGNRTNLPYPQNKHYSIKESDHICYSWSDIEKIEVTP